MIKRHQMIKQRRESLSLTQRQMAELVGVTEATYDHVEREGDELTMAIPLKGARVLARTLGLDLGDLLGIGTMPPPGASGQKYPRHRLVADARKRLGVSVEKMADDIGFEPIFVTELERDDGWLETFPSEVFEIVAKYLKIPVWDLIGDG